MSDVRFECSMRACKGEISVRDEGREVALLTMARKVTAHAVYLSRGDAERLRDWLNEWLADE